MLKYELGEMKSIDGSVLRFEVESEVEKYSLKISHNIGSANIYKELYKKLPSQRVLLYFQSIIVREIYLFMVQACVIEWYVRNNKQIPEKEKAVKVPNAGIFQVLKECWNFKNAPLVRVNPFYFFIKSPSLIRKLLKEYVRTLCKWFKLSTKGFFLGLRPANPVPRSKEYSFTASGVNKGLIACHYTEGVDFSRHNDLNWYVGSGIPAENVLIYFDNLNRGELGFIQKEVIAQIERLGFKWASLCKGSDSHYWEPPLLKKDIFLKRQLAKNSLEKWIIEQGNVLIEQVNYWRSFYDDFNVKINYTPEIREPKNIAQAIAFDISEHNQGAVLGKQKSEVSFPCIGYSPKHVFFVWNKRTKDFLQQNHDKIETFVITGYPDDDRQKRTNVAKALQAKGANFILGLFDTTYGPNIYCSEMGMSEFYRVLLEWLLEDGALGIIIKPKKPDLTARLDSIIKLLDKACETGRCVMVKDSFGKLPLEFSNGIDMAIGVGISSAVTEVAISGARGIHYDMPQLKSHEFYRWGYERLIFDNLEKMVTALKRYKKNPANEPGLGDWSSYLDTLDPFRDSRGGERMGTYMRFLLESFDEGKDRDEAIRYANEQYAKQWGTDKIIDMRYEYVRA